MQAGEARWPILYACSKLRRGWLFGARRQAANRSMPGRREPGRTSDPRRAAPCAAAALLAALLALARPVRAPDAGDARTARAPNIVVIQTDDQTLRELYATWRRRWGSRHG